MEVKSAQKILFFYTVITLISGLILVFLFRNIISGDYISYVSLAKKYVALDFGNAVNGLWSPLISWVAAPFIWLGIPENLVFKLIQLTFGIGILVQFWKLLVEQKIKGILLHGGMTMISIYVLFFVSSVYSPDTLLVFLLLLYFRHYHLIFEEKRYAVLVGIIAALAYFSKAYALPFLLLHITVISLIRYYEFRQNARKEKTSIKSYGLVNLGWFIRTFLVVSSLWILPLSINAGHLTYSSSGEFNWVLKMRTPINGEVLFPIELELIAPPNATAVSIWENLPSNTGSFDWKIQLDFSEIIQKQSKILFTNIRGVAYDLHHFNALFIATFLLTLILIVGRLKSNKLTENELFKAFIFAFLFPAGYYLIFVGERYIWIVFVMTVYIQILMSNYFLKQYQTNKLQRLILVLSLIIFSCFVPADITRNIYNKKLNVHNDIYEKANDLRRSIPEGASIASDIKFTNAMYLTYWLGASYYGQTERYPDKSKIEADLLRHQIEYFLVYRKDAEYDYLEGYPEITGGKLPGLKVYKLY